MQADRFIVTWLHKIDRREHVASSQRFSGDSRGGLTDQVAREVRGFKLEYQKWR
jgi:hypothetical protein